MVNFESQGPDHREETGAGTFGEDGFRSAVEEVEEIEESVEDETSKLEEEKGPESFDENNETFEKGRENAIEKDKERIGEIKAELGERAASEDNEAKKIEIKEALERVIDKIKEEKIKIQNRIEEEVHFKKAFPFLSMFGRFGRSMAQNLYPDEYEVKVEAKEEADESTLSRLEMRELEAELQISNLDKEDQKVITPDHFRNVLKQIWEEGEKLAA